MRVLIGRGLILKVQNSKYVQIVISLFNFERTVQLTNASCIEFFQYVGVYSGEGPPVPIPNTVVKLTRVENTWLVTAREDRSSPTLRTFSSVGRATDS